MHDFPRRAREGTGIRLHQTAQVPVRDDSEQSPFAVLNRCDPEALARHLVDHVLHRRVDCDAGHEFPGVHQLPNGEQPFAEPAAGVKLGEILWFETLAYRHDHREGVA